MPPCDVVLVCLKSVNNGKLQSLLTPASCDWKCVIGRTVLMIIKNPQPLYEAGDFLW